MSTQTAGWLENLSISKKMSLVPIIILAMLITIGTITFFDSKNINTQIERIQTQSVPKTVLASDLLKTNLEAETLIGKFLQELNPEYIKKLELLKEKQLWLNAELKTYDLSEVEKQTIEELNNNFSKYFTLVFSRLIPESQEASYLVHHLSEEIIPVATLNLQNIQLSSNQDETIEEAGKAIKHLLIADRFLHLYFEENKRQYFNRMALELIGLKDAIENLKLMTLSDKQLTWLQKTENNTETFKKEIKQLKHDLDDIDQLTHNELLTLTAEVSDQSLRIRENVWNTMGQANKKLKASTEQLTLTTIILVLASLLIASFLIWLISRKVKTSLLKLKNTISQVQESGDFSLRADIYSKDEIGVMAQAFNQMLSAQSQAINEIKQVMKLVASGTFNQQINANLQGDFNDLKNGVNQTVDQLESIFQELNLVNKALANGDFSKQIEQPLEGEFLVAAEAVNHSVELLNQFVDQTNSTMEQVSQGALNVAITMHLPGKLDSMKQAINSSIDTLNKVINETNQVAKSQASGVLDQRIEGQYQGSFDELKTSINTSANELESIVGQIQQASDNVLLAVQQVSSGSLDLSDRTQNQAASLEETAASLEEVTATIQSNTEAAKLAERQAHTTKTKSREGMEIVQKAQKTMNEISESSEQIAEIIGLIDSISFQTNLLALNAAVEAARAGEHGRGFAVVAGEVRNLAQKSAEAANNIKTLIETSVEQVKLGEKHVSATEKMLGEIDLSIVEVNRMIESIYKASEQQQHGIEQINHAVTGIDGITQQNAALAEETSSTATQMENDSDTMKKALSFFKSNQPPKLH